MNWYRKSTSAIMQPTPEGGMTLQFLKDLMDETTGGFYGVIKVLQYRNVEFDIIDFPQNKIVVVTFQGQKYVIDDCDYPQLEEANEWIWGLTDSQISNYIPQYDFNKSFWEGVGKGFKVYHATNRYNVYNITKNGLLPKSNTRGLSNKGTGDAIFTSDNPNDISAYGDIILEINVSLMKQNGFTPMVSMESPIEDAKLRESIAHKIGMEDFDATSNYTSEGIYETTLIFYENIPPQYIKIYQDNQGD